MKTVFLFCYIFVFVKSQEKCSDRQNSCSDCIRLPGCAWNLDVTKNGCFPVDNKTGVNPTKLYNPESSLTILENKPLNENIKIAPQKVELKLRLRNAVQFKISLDKDDGLPQLRLQDIRIEYIRKVPDEIIAEVEALSCPNNKKDFHQSVPLVSYQTQQSVSLEIDIICECGK